MTKKYLSDEVYAKTLLSTETTDSDLVIKTGTAKTIVLDTTVYKDALMAFAFKGTNDEAVVDTFVGNIKQYKFEIGKVLYINNTEAPHDYKYGTEIEIHLHWAIKSDLVAGDKVNWQFEFAIANSVRNGNVMTIFCDPANTAVFGTKTVQVEFTCPTGGLPAGTGLYTTIGTISGANMSNVKIGCAFIGTLSRIAKSAGGTSPATGTVYAQNMGIHYQVDTLGSRTRTEK
jgi:hypothetical protein